MDVVTTEMKRIKTKICRTMKCDGQLGLFYLLSTDFHTFILYLWKLQWTWPWTPLQRRPSCCVWWPLSFNGVKWTSNMIKNQESTTRHKGLKLLTFVTCHFLMARIFRYFEMMKNSSHLFFKRLFGTSRHPAGGLACSVNWNSFILYQNMFQNVLGLYKQESIQIWFIQWVTKMCTTILLNLNL